MRTIRFCAVLLAGCAVFAVGVAVGGAGQGLQRFQIVTHSGPAAGILHRLDRVRNGKMSRYNGQTGRWE